MEPGEPEMTEDQAYPANPDNEYGWEKLYAERTAQAYARRYGFTLRIARFQNCYGPEGTWRGGRRRRRPRCAARSPRSKMAAPSKSGATAPPCARTPTSPTWSTRSIGSCSLTWKARPTSAAQQYVTVDQLVATVAEVAGKRVQVKHIDGPVGVQSRNFSNERIYSTGWRPRYSLRDGIAETYPWIEAPGQSQPRPRVILTAD